MENLEGIRDSYGQALLDLAKKNPKILVLATDSKFSSKVDKFEKQFADRFFELGICEQNMVGVAAGLAISGKIPFISAIACFMSMRCFEQIRTSVAIPNLNVKIVGMSSGFAYPQLGPTHTCLEDVSIMRAVSNMVVISPADNMETYKATLAIADYDGPVYMRLGRYPVPKIYDEDYEFKIGKATILKNGSDITIIATGPSVTFAMEACRLLAKENIDARLINLSTIKPLDEDLILTAAAETGCIITVEEHNIAGGMGSAVAEFLAQKYPVKMRFLGIPNKVPAAAPRDVLLERYNLTPLGIAGAARTLLEQK